MASISKIDKRRGNSLSTSHRLWSSWRPDQRRCRGMAPAMGRRIVPLSWLSVARSGVSLFRTSMVVFSESGPEPEVYAAEDPLWWPNSFALDRRGSNVVDGERLRKLKNGAAQAPKGCGPGSARTIRADGARSPTPGRSRFNITGFGLLSTRAVEPGDIHGHALSQQLALGDRRHRTLSSALGDRGAYGPGMRGFFCRAPASGSLDRRRSSSFDGKLSTKKCDPGDYREQG